MSTIFWREKRYVLLENQKSIEYLGTRCLSPSAGPHHTCDVSISFPPQEIGNPNAYRGQTGGNEAGSHCSELESQVLSGGAATALFQIIIARHYWNFEVMKTSAQSTCNTLDSDWKIYRKFKESGL